VSSCDDNKTNTTVNRGACAVLVTSASPSSPRTSAASTSSGSGSRGDGGVGGSSGKGSGFRGSGRSRVTIFTLAPQILVTAVSTAGTATVNLLEGLQKTAKGHNSVPAGSVVTSTGNHVATVTSSMDADQQQLPACEGELKVMFIFAKRRSTTRLMVLYDTFPINLKFQTVAAFYQENCLCALLKPNITKYSHAHTISQMKQLCTPVECLHP
jgi:hypothetical protein